MKEGRKPEYPEKTPGDELQNLSHSFYLKKKQKNKAKQNKQTNKASK